MRSIPSPAVTDDPDPPANDPGRRDVEFTDFYRAEHAPQVRRAILLDVVSRLPFNQRAAIVLRFYAGMTETEIAAALDVPTGSIGPWTKRALTTMNKELS